MHMGRDSEGRESPNSAPSADFAPDIELALTATRGEASILPGAATQVLHYVTEVMDGDLAAVSPSNGYLGPVLRVQRGQTVRVHFRNELDSESIIHWHGLVVPAAMDGHPRSAIAPGETFVYEFEVQNRAGTYWFHPHPHGHTGRQVYAGLTGLFLVSDEEEAALDLPSGEYDLPLVIQDRQFNADNQLVYLGDSATEESGGGRGMMGNMGGMMGGGMDAAMERMMGVLGDRILVNGEPDAAIDVAARPYRLRLLNGSTARIYKLGWADGTPLTVIGTDDGLLERPVQKPYLTLAPGQRRELWVDFGEYPVGTELQLESVPFEGVEAGGMMMDGMMHNAPNDTASVALPQGARFPVLAVRVARESDETQPLPERLATVETLDANSAVNAGEPRVFALAGQHMEWTINGETYDMNNVNPDTQVALGTTEIWEFANLADAGMMTDFMAHPMHVHGVHFQIVGRDVDPAYRPGWETLIDGTVEEGWHDTVMVMPGERVRVAARFSEPGLFVQHCHILEHEDLGMMRNFLVG